MDGDLLDTLYLLLANRNHYGSEGSQLSPARPSDKSSGERSISGMTLVKVKLSLEQTMKAQRGSRGIALLFL